MKKNVKKRDTHVYIIIFVLYREVYYVIPWMRWSNHKNKTKTSAVDAINYLFIVDVRDCWLYRCRECDWSCVEHFILERNTHSDYHFPIF